MADYKNKPYAVFVEEAVKMLFELDPASICIQAELADGRKWSLSAGGLNSTIRMGQRRSAV